ncbi:hypothetical protein Bbelb_298670 [Branchiostoma belcheri]|nr:hypothetical protein Bbelb_298670 [Branchiostoma belcheri]
MGCGHSRWPAGGVLNYSPKVTGKTDWRACPQGLEHASAAKVTRVILCVNAHIYVSNETSSADHQLQEELSICYKDRIRKWRLLPSSQPVPCAGLVLDERQNYIYIGGVRGHSHAATAGFRRVCRKS